MNRMIIYTFRKNLGKIRVDIYYNIYIIVYKCWEIYRKMKLKNSQLLNQYRTLQETWYGCIGRSFAPSEEIWGKLQLIYPAKPKPIQKSTNDLVWMTRMIICTFRKNLGKIKVIYPVILIFYVNIFRIFLKIYQNRPKNDIRKFIAPTPIQNSTNDQV